MQTVTKWTPTHIRLSQPITDALDKLAARDGEPCRATIIRRALAEYVQRRGVAPGGVELETEGAVNG